MKQRLNEVIKQIELVAGDAWNPDTYFETKVQSEGGMFIAKYMLGNAFIKGYSEKTGENFEIFKDHSTWQIWVWDIEGEKDQTRNQFNAPYYRYDKVQQFIEKNL